ARRANLGTRCWIMTPREASRIPMSRPLALARNDPKSRGSRDGRGARGEAFYACDVEIRNRDRQRTMVSERCKKSNELTAGQLDRLTVRRCARRAVPFVLPCRQLVGQHQPLVGHELLQRGQPEVVVTRAVVGLAARLRRGDLVRQPLCPLLPRDVAALVKHHG